VNRRAAWLVAVVAVGGCAVAPVAPPPVTLADPGVLQEWTASGRLALAANGEGGSGTFTWEQQSEATALTIRGPLGAGALQVTSDGRSLAVTDGEGRHLDTEQAQVLLRKRLGADLPLGELRYWMLGVPSPGSPASVADAAEPPRRVIEQSGWRIGYDSFRPAAGVSLPERFTASQGGVRLRVVVDDWQVAAARGRGP
jgi:outer membrane lipoprotein LolB